MCPYHTRALCIPHLSDVLLWQMMEMLSDKRNFLTNFKHIRRRVYRVNNGVMQHITQFKMVNKNQLHLPINANYYDVCDVEKDWSGQEQNFFSWNYFTFISVHKGSRFVTHTMWWWGKPKTLKRWFQKINLKKKFPLPYLSVGIGSPPTVYNMNV